jgi:uncharacterized membrane protein
MTRGLSGVLARNALLAGLYAAVALVLPATAFANFRLATALYALAAFDRTLVPGLAVGNAIAGLPQGPVDVVLGLAVGFVTSLACAHLPPLLAPLAVLIVPTLMVPLWLSALFHAPYMTVLPVVAVGQAASAGLAWLVVVPAGRLAFKRQEGVLPRDARL